MMSIYRIGVNLYVDVLTDLSCFSVLGDEFSEDADSLDPQDLARHSGLLRTLPLTRTRVSALSLGQHSLSHSPPNKRYRKLEMLISSIPRGGSLKKQFCSSEPTRSLSRIISSHSKLRYHACWRCFLRYQPNGQATVDLKLWLRNDLLKIKIQIKSNSQQTADNYADLLAEKNSEMNIETKKQTTVNKS